MSSSPANSASIAGTITPEHARPTLRGAPAQLTSFVGRAREIAAARDALGKTRLLTLTGAGGSGKTRLALEVATREVEAGGGAGAWVELATVRDPALVGEAVLTVLGVRDEGDAPAVERIVGLVDGEPFLLVIDNGEHLVEACAQLVDALLRRAPMLRVMVTSRAALGVAGEVAWLVPPLALPAADGDAARSEAVQLFVQRAAAVVPGFTLTSENTAAIVQICRRLDGLPLALELAAARLRALVPEQVAARLDDRFRLLTTGNRAALPRHQTLRAAIDWSYDLLEPRGRSLLARLSVFAGSFSLEGVEGICAGDGIDAGDILDLLASLVDQSLVEVVESDGTARYRLLETVREYAAGRLAEAGAGEERRRRHAEYFAALVTEAEPYLRTVQRPAWLSRLSRETENVRQALAWTRDHDRPLHVRLVGRLHWFWFASGLWPEARQWLRVALAMPEAEGATRERAALLFSSGGLAALQSLCETSIPQLQEAVAIAESLGDGRLLADARNYLAMSYNATRDPRAEETVLAARPWMIEHGDLYALRLNYLLMGTSRLISGDIATAIEATEEGVRAARVFGLDRELAIALQQLAMLVRRQGDIPRAAALLRESLEAIRRDPQFLFIARAVEYMASSAVVLAPREAVRLYAAAQAMRSSMGAVMWKVDEMTHLPAQETLRASLGEQAWQAAWREGERLDVAAATELAISVCDVLCAQQPHEPSRDTSEFEVMHLPAVASTKPAPREAEVVLRVRALGKLSIALEGGGGAGKGFAYAKARELLVLLLVHPEGRTREQLGAALWPDATAAQVRNSFHVAMHHLRRALGHAEWVRFERERYRLELPSAVDFDARRFEDAAFRALREVKRGAANVQALREGLALYGGDFMEGEQAEDWHLELRDRLARLRLELLEALGGAHLAAGKWGEAIVAFERIIEQDATYERACRALATAHARAGDRDAALRTFRRLEAAMRREGIASAAKETIELHRRLSRGETP